VARRSILRTGKCLNQKLSEMVVRFRSPPDAVQKQCESPVYPNDLIIKLQPDEASVAGSNGKVPRWIDEHQAVALDFNYEETFHVASPEAYERLIFDAMVGIKHYSSARRSRSRLGRDRSDRARLGAIEASSREVRTGHLGAQAGDGPDRMDGRRWAQGIEGAPEPIIACALP